MLTECIQNYGHYHDQNYEMQIMHTTKIMDAVAIMAGKKLGDVIIQIMYTTSQNHSHKQNYDHSQIRARGQNNMALAGKTLGVVIIQIIYTTS